MYYPELTQTTQDVQRMIDACCSENNIAITVSEQVEQLRDYIQTLDPSSVNFVKQDIFNKRKIKVYWDKFIQLADSLDNIIEHFYTNERVLGNTIATLKNKKVSSNIIINSVKRNVDASDSVAAETMQQLIVAEQSIQVLDNLINEYSMLMKRVQDIQNVCITAFRQAILIAKTQDNFSKINTVAYESNYRAVKSLLD